MDHRVESTRTLSNILAAIEVVQEEQSRTQAEADAFDAFIGRLNDTNPSQEQLTLGPQHSVVSTSVANTDQAQQIQQLYRDTVMAVNHYEEEYNDTVAESMADEFGPDITTQLLSDSSFTPLLQQHLLQAAAQCQQTRARFLSTLEMEHDALETARTTIEGITDDLESELRRSPSEFSSEELLPMYTNLYEGEQRCEPVLDERQQQRPDGHAAVDTVCGSLSELHTYLYAPLSVTHPVLSDTTTLLAELQ